MTTPRRGKPSVVPVSPKGHANANEGSAKARIALRCEEESCTGKAVPKTRG